MKGFIEIKVELVSDTSEMEVWKQLTSIVPDWFIEVLPRFHQ